MQLYKKITNESGQLYVAQGRMAAQRYGTTKKKHNPEMFHIKLEVKYAGGEKKVIFTLHECLVETRNP